MLILSTDSLRGYGINRIFHFAKDSGFEGIEVALDSRNFDTQNAEYLNELQQQYKLPIRAVSAFGSGTIQQTSLAFEIGNKVEAKVVIVDPPRLFDFKVKDWMKKQVPGFRKKYGVSIALKNGPSEYVWGVLPGRSMNSLADLQNFKEICLDISNLYGKNADLMRTYDLIKNSLRHIHLSNVVKGLDHMGLEDGIMPLESFLTKLKKDEYEHDISLLVRPKVLQAGDDTAVMKQLEKALKFCHEYLG